MSARTRLFSLFVACGALVTLTAHGEDCEPKRNCDATRDCSLQVDTSDCEPHWGCDCRWYDPRCSKLLCEADKARFKTQCETKKAARNAAYAAAKATCETQKSAEKLDCERIKTQMKIACQNGLDGPFSCSAGEVLAQLRTGKQKGLTDFEELAGALTTPIKNAAGQLSWRETACQASGIGVPYLNSQRSTDGFCTLDVHLIAFSVGGQDMPPGDHYIRLELLPGGKAATLCSQQTISTLDRVRFGGPVKIDKHFPGERWLEVHVTDDFDVIPSGATKSTAVGAGTGNGPASSLPATARKGSEVADAQSYNVRRGDCLSKIAERAYGRQAWTVLFRANRSQIRNPNLIYPGQILQLPPI